MSKRMNIATPRKAKDGKTFWTNIGTAWFNDNGGSSLCSTPCRSPTARAAVSPTCSSRARRTAGHNSASPHTPASARRTKRPSDAPAPPPREQQAPARGQAVPVAYQVGARASLLGAGLPWRSNRGGARPQRNRRKHVGQAARQMGNQPVPRSSFRAAPDWRDQLRFQIPHQLIALAEEFAARSPHRFKWMEQDQ
jgi:hypothetical protein